MSFYVYRAVDRVFLASDERSWTPDFFDAAGFTSRDLAEGIATRELGGGHEQAVSMKTWDFRVHRLCGAGHLGQVSADTKDAARCAALPRWGVTDDELRVGEADAAHAILPLDDFDVSAA